MEFRRDSLGDLIIAQLPNGVLNLDASESGMVYAILNGPDLADAVKAFMGACSSGDEGCSSHIENVVFERPFEELVESMINWALQDGLYRSLGEWREELAKALAKVEQALTTKREATDA